jgi:hypothetical protein
LWSSHSERCRGDERRAGQVPHDRFHTSSHPCGDHDCATPRPFDSTLKIGAVNREVSGTGSSTPSEPPFAAAKESVTSFVLPFFAGEAGCTYDELRHR